MVVDRYSVLKNISIKTMTILLLLFYNEATRGKTKGANASAGETFIGAVTSPWNGYFRVVVKLKNVKQIFWIHILL